MKKVSSIIICILLGTGISIAQCLNWQWAKSTTGDGGQEGFSVTTDADGNVYQIGVFTGDVIAFGNNILVNSNAYLDGFDIYVVKYSPLGEVLWTKTAVVLSPSSVYGASVATDQNNNVYITGYFAGDSVTFDQFTIHTIHHDFNNWNNIFVLKFDSSGNTAWVKVPGGNYMGAGNEMTVDIKNNIYLTGEFAGDSIVFGPHILHNPTTGFSFSNFFIAKYSPTGNVLWAKAPVIADSTNAYGYGVRTDNTGNVYVTGKFYGDSIIFDNVTLRIKSAPGEGIFVVEYDSSGNLVWAKMTDGNPGAAPFGIAVNESNDAFVTGYFTGDSLTWGTSSGYSLGSLNSNAFIAKLDRNGNALWVKTATVPQNMFAIGQSVTVDKENNIFLSGGFGDSVTFDNTTLCQPLDSNLDYDPMFLYKLDSNGNVICAKAFLTGGGGKTSSCIDKNGNGYIGGDIRDVAIIFGTDTLNSGNETAFVAKFSSGNEPASVAGVSPSGSLQLQPNPFTTEATVQYSLPAGSKNAFLIIYDMLGRQQNSYSLNSSNGEISINAGNLSAGIYLYSLVMNNRVLFTEKMVVQ